MPASGRYLVVVRAGDKSLHSGWTDALATRDWDLVVSYYGADPSRFRDAGDRRIDDRGPKWPGLHALLTRETFWREYDYIWLPDDDLAIGQTAISRLFSLAAELDLELAQPALSWRSFYSHEITVRHPSFVARYTDFIEIMAPCLSVQLLEACLPLFGETQSGWGLDLLLPLRCKSALGCAIVDEVEATHTRRVGGPNYAALRAGATPAEEARSLAARHGLRNAPPQVLGAIERGGRRLDAAVPEQASRLRDLLGKDMMAFLASRLRVETSETLVALARPRAAGRSQS
jgi:hypothetical protein